MYIHIFIVSALLFFALSPGILFQFQTNISKYTIAFIHALFFGGLFISAFKYYKEWFLREGKRIKGIKVSKNGGMKTEGKRQCYKKSKESRNTCYNHSKNTDQRKTCQATYLRARAICKAMI